VADPIAQLGSIARALRVAPEAMHRAAAETLGREGEATGRDAVRAAAGRLPSRGGLGALVAQSSLSVSRGASGATIRASGPVALGPLDEGSLRHPLWGNRAHWYSQSVESGWWSETFAREAQGIATELGRDVSRVADRIIT
jgi:hypothetical protein